MPQTYVDLTLVIQYYKNISNIKRKELLLELTARVNNTL